MKTSVFSQFNKPIGQQLPIRCSTHFNVTVFEGVNKDKKQSITTTPCFYSTWLAHGSRVM